jgi:hypothetical protein
MSRIACLGVAALLLAACNVFGPPAIDLSRADIAERAFFDRKNPEYRRLFKGMEAMNISGPDVGFQLVAQRVELAWTAKLADGPMGIPLALTVSISGAPVLNAEKSGIDLADTRIEAIRLPSVPFFNLDPGKVNRPGDSLGTLALLKFRPEELNRDGVVYQATTLSLGTFGLRVELAPK